MNAVNTRFAHAVHVLTFLHVHGGGPIASSKIAQSVNTAPTFVRRSMQFLARAGITKAREGEHGGAMLAKPGSSITLQEVYDAVNGGGDDFALHRDPDPACVVGRHIETVLTEVVYKVEESIRAQLAQITIADVASDVVEREGISPGHHDRAWHSR